jgi:hypothetical protein
MLGGAGTIMNHDACRRQYASVERLANEEQLLAANIVLSDNLEMGLVVVTQAM